MPDKVISSADEVTAEWLTAVLSGSGVLAQGTVTSFDLDTGQGNWSTNARLIRYHILLDNVSESHIVAAEKETTLEYGLALAEGLAALHARWWGAQRLAEAGAPIHSARHLQRFVDIAKPGVGHIPSRVPNEQHNCI